MAHLPCRAIFVLQSKPPQVKLDTCISCLIICFGRDILPSPIEYHSQPARHFLCIHFFGCGGRGLQQVRALFFKAEESLFPDGKDSFVNRAIVGYLYQRIADAHVVVLVTAHEAAQFHNAG